MSETRKFQPDNRCGSCSQHTMIAALRTVLADRERELFQIKGPCRTPDCRLHYAHSGPCAVESTLSATHPDTQHGQEAGER